MPFLVHERDPLVLADIFETLAGAFSEVVHHVPDLSLLRDLLLRPAADLDVYVLSIDRRDIETALSDVLPRMLDSKVVLISNSLPDTFELSGGRAFVSRPFTSESLLKGVNAVLSDPPSDPQ